MGACLGAKYGIEGIPSEWMGRTLCVDRAMRLAIDIVSTI